MLRPAGAGVKEEIGLKAYHAKDIRNIAIAGHGGRGKTTLAEAMLYLAGVTERLGRIADGNTVLDYDGEEKKRRASVSTAVAPLEWNCLLYTSCLAAEKSSGFPLRFGGI